jgi:hypothetical protein
MARSPSEAFARLGDPIDEGLDVLVWRAQRQNESRIVGLEWFGALDGLIDHPVASAQLDLSLELLDGVEEACESVVGVIA